MEAGRKNPFSPENIAKKREALLKNLRAERGVPEPRHAEERTDDGARAAEPQRSESHVAADNNAGVSESSGQAQGSPQAVEGVSEAQNEWYKREQAVRAAEERIKEASTKAEMRAAEAEKKEAEAKAAVQRMEWAKDDPIAFLAETGMTQDEWSAFLANGGKLSPEQKRLKEMEKQLAETRQAMEQMEQNARTHAERARLAQEESQFAPKLQNLTYVPQMGGMAAIRDRQALLARQTGTPVSLEDAADNLETEMQRGLQRILQDPKIRSSLKLNVDTPQPAGQVAEKPRTLSNRVASESSTQGVKPHPLDWKAKQKLYQQRVERERQALANR